MTIIATLTHIIKNNKILLIRKKKGLGKGLMNAPGGKVEEGEDIRSTAIREVKEELGITVQRIVPMVILIFYFGYKDEPDWIVYVFKCDEFKGNPRPSDEVDPFWVSLNEIPYDDMWKDDKIWLPLFLRGEKFVGVFVFDERIETIKKWLLKSISDKDIEKYLGDYKLLMKIKLE